MKTFLMISAAGNLGVWVAAVFPIPVVWWCTCSGDLSLFTTYQLRVMHILMSSHTQFKPMSFFVHALLILILMSIAIF